MQLELFSARTTLCCRKTILRQHRECLFTTLNSKRNPYARHQSDALETQLIRVVHLLFGSCTLRFHLTLLDISRSKATDIGKHIQMRQHTVRNTAIYIYSPGVCSHLIFRFVLPTFIGIPQITASVTDRQDAAVGYITTKFIWDPRS